VLGLFVFTSIIWQGRAITWSINTKRLTSYAYYDGFPAFMQTKDGRVWLAWSRETDANLSLCYKITSDHGKTWSPEANLTNPMTDGQDQNPAFLQAKNGTIWVVWTSDRPSPSSPPTPDFSLAASPQNVTLLRGASENTTITVTSLNDFDAAVDLTILNEPLGVTTTFDPTPVVPPPNGTANSTLTISSDVTATPGTYTLTVLGSGDHLWRTVDVYVEITATGGSSPTSKAVSVLSTPASSAAASMNDYEIYYKSSHDNGQTWSQDVPLTDNSLDDLRPAIIQLSNGTIMIIWQSYISGSHNICYATTTDGISWSPLTQLTTASAHDKGPTATVTRDSTIWVAWASRRTGNYEIFFKTYDGLGWSSDTQLTFDSDSDVQPAIVQTIDDDILIFWASSPATGTYDIYYKSSSDGGATWSGRIAFVATSYQDMWPAAIRTQDTKIWVAYVNDAADQPDGNWEIYYRSSLAGDVNEDNQTNVMDLTIVSLSYGMLEGEPGYNPDADINKDGIVDMRDLRIVAYYLGET
jgi:hypothetical protein